MVFITFIIVSAAASASDYEYAVKDDGIAVLVRYRGEEEHPVVPSEINGYTITAIGNNAFDGSKSVKAITLPQTITSIGMGAFLGTSLTSIIIPEKVETIGENVFQSLVKLEEVCFPVALRSIDNMAFYECYAMKEIVLPEGIEHIGSSAFEWCTGLERVILPASITHIGIDAFANCKKELEFTVRSGSYAEKYCRENGLNYTCEGSVDVINNAVEEYVLGEGEYMENGIVYIVMQRGSAQIVDYVGKDKELIIPEKLGEHKVRQIGALAFEGCKTIESVIVLDSVERIDLGAFTECAALSNVVLPKNIELYGYVFSDCSSLTSIMLPEGVNLGNNDFAGCESLVEIQLQSNDGYDVIDGVLFEVWRNGGMALLCYPLGLEKTSYAIPAGTETIRANAFTGSKKLKEISIPDTVNYIDGYAFAYCEELERIEIPNEKCEVWSMAFSGCRKLEYVQLPRKLEAIYKEVFKDCAALKEIDIPDSVTLIDEGAFLNCVSLESLTIPAGVTEIGYNAFEGCEKLTVLVNPGSYAETYCKENNVPYAYTE